MRPTIWKAVFCGVAIFLLASNALTADFKQDGTKLVGADGDAFCFQGWSVSISGDGNAAIVGGPLADGAWVFTRVAGDWTQQGSKLVGTDASTFGANQGQSVALSADAHTAIVGGHTDNFGQGAAWIFVRNGGVWTQQGPKLVGTGAIDNAFQGESVSLSANGDTAIVGGPSDNSGVGAAWIFARSGDLWSQQGTKLVGTGAVGQSWQGQSVSLSGDGNTAAVGGPSTEGAVWIFTRTGGVWTQQGSKLFGSGGSDSIQGFSVSLARNGNTLIIGGPGDNGVGAAWIFVRMGGLWSQQGSKLVGTGVEDYSNQGRSVALSGDGNTAIVGASTDHPYIGAAWIFRRSGSLWQQVGDKLVAEDYVGSAIYQGDSVALSADGNTAIVGGHGDNSAKGAAWVFVSVADIPAMTTSALVLLALGLTAVAMTSLKT